MKIINCNVLFSIFLLFSYFYIGLAWADGTLFSDDFEGDTVGQPASLWELAGGAPGKGAKVVKDPLDPNNKVIFVNSPKWVGDLPEGAWVPKDKSYLKWTDYTFEGDFMVDDPSKLFAFNYRAKDYDNMMHYNVRRWDIRYCWRVYARKGGMDWSYQRNTTSNQTQGLVHSAS